MTQKKTSAVICLTLLMCSLLMSSFFTKITSAAPIFSDGYETGDFTAWTSTTGGPTVTDTRAHHGTYSMLVDNTWHFSTYTFGGAQTEYYAREYIYHTGSLNDGQYIILLGDAAPRAYASIINSGGDYLWRITYVNNAWATVSENSVATMTQDQWYCVELWWKDQTANGVKLYVDGVAVITASGTTADTTATGLNFGSSAGTTSTYYLDCAAYDSSYIGLEADTTAPTYSSLTYSTTVHNTLCNFGITVDDDVSLSHYIFSTNNTGAWVNNTVTAFASTPQTVSASKTLNDTIGQWVGYRWFMNDTTNNWNDTGIEAFEITDYTGWAHKIGNIANANIGNICGISKTLIAKVGGS